MARITVEDCLREENNRFALVQLAAKRTKQILHGSKTVIEDPRANKAVVMALREIASGKVRFMTEEEMRIVEEQEREEAKLQAEREAATVSSSDLEIANLLFGAATTSIADEAALADDELADDEDAEEGDEDEDLEAADEEDESDDEGMNDDESGEGDDESGAEKDKETDGGNKDDSSDDF